MSQRESKAPLADGQTKARYTIRRVDIQDRTVVVEWEDDHVSRFHSIWLRDNCHGEDSIAHGTSQRLFDSASIPHLITPTRLVMTPEGCLDGDLESWRAPERLQPLLAT